MKTAICILAAEQLSPKFTIAIYDPDEEESLDDAIKRTFHATWKAPSGIGDDDWFAQAIPSFRFIEMHTDVAEKLKNLEYPDVPSHIRHEAGTQMELLMIKVCEAFAIPSLKDALRAYDDPTIIKALDAGWEPPSTHDAMESYVECVERKELGQMYADHLMLNHNDTELCVDNAWNIFAGLAEQFLEPEEEPSRPKAPKDMSTPELIEEATQLHSGIKGSPVKVVGKIVRLGALEEELVDRGYVISRGSEYDITLEMLEE